MQAFFYKKFKKFSKSSGIPYFISFLHALIFCRRPRIHSIVCRFRPRLTNLRFRHGFEYTALVSL